MNVYRGLALLAAACSALSIGAQQAAAMTPPARLLALYEPIAHFDPQERFLPTSVESFIADSNLEQLGATGTWATVDSDPEPGELPGPRTGVWRLDQDSCTPAAAVGGLDCYVSAWSQGSGGPAVYGRVTRQDDRIVLQYWYFYYDDVYSYHYPPSNFIWQAHEGDWEVVNVVLSEDEEPLFVAYSQHCLGQRRAWADTPRLGEHPIVYVAIGSHANYFETGTHPIDARCIPQAVLGFFVRAGLPLPNDYVFSGGAAAGPPEAGGSVAPIHRIADDLAWVAFPGFWGELQYFHAPGITAPLGTSPVGPAYHRVWSDPLSELAKWS